MKTKSFRSLLKLYHTIDSQVCFKAVFWWHTSASLWLSEIKLRPGFLHDTTYSTSISWSWNSYQQWKVIHRQTAAYFTENFEDYFSLSISKNSKAISKLLTDFKLPYLLLWPSLIFCNSRNSFVNFLTELLAHY